MRIFFCHASRDKPLIREIRSRLPRHLQPWVDEENLLIGDDLGVSIEKAIRDESDFVVIFIGMEAVASGWVKRELCWALDHEKALGRTFVFPVVLDVGAWSAIEPASFRKRKYLECTDFSEAGVQAFAQQFNDELFAWLSRHLDQEKLRPKIIVEMLAVSQDDQDDYSERLRQQGAPPEAIAMAQELMGSLPTRALVIKARNEGRKGVLLTGYGVKATQDGKKTILLPPLPADGRSCLVKPVRTWRLRRVHRRPGRFANDATRSGIAVLG